MAIHSLLTSNSSTSLRKITSPGAIGVTRKESVRSAREVAAVEGEGSGFYPSFFYNHEQKLLSGLHDHHDVEWSPANTWSSAL